MIHRQPVQWYVDQLNAGKPFASLLYGDGEFFVASRRRTGRAMQNGEVVTAALEDEMRASFLVADDGPPIYRGTEPFLVEPWTYGGRDKDAVNQSATALQLSLPPGAAFDWYDGTVWDTAVREGELGPLIKALRNRDTLLVGNMQLVRWFNYEIGSTSRTIPDNNACEHLSAIESWAFAARPDLNSVFVVCMGVGAIPLIMRLRKRNPHATYLDLGSTFDVFARIGAERGWRREAYADEAKWKGIVEKNLEGAR